MKISKEAAARLGFREKRTEVQPQARQQVQSGNEALLQRIRELEQALALERAKRQRLAEILRPMLQQVRNQAQVPQGRAYRSDGGRAAAQEQAPQESVPRVVTPEVLPPEELVEPVVEEEAPPEDSLQRALRDTMDEDDDLEALLEG